MISCSVSSSCLLITKGKVLIHSVWCWSSVAPKPGDMWVTEIYSQRDFGQVSLVQTSPVRVLVVKESDRTRGLKLMLERELCSIKYKSQAPIKFPTKVIRVVLETIAELCTAKIFPPKLIVLVHQNRMSWIMNWREQFGRRQKPLKSTCSALPLNERIQLNKCIIKSVF